jgi:outer membrane protein
MRQRAATRAVDENVAIALGGYRPRVTGTASYTHSYLESLTRAAPTNICNPPGSRNCGDVGATTYSITASQTLFNGFQTGNRTRQAEAQVFSARETLRSTEQTVLLNGATAYMNLLRDTALLDLQRNNVTVLEATLRQTRESLQCRRRSDAHRRGAGGIAACRRPLLVADRGIELHHIESGLSAGDRR